MFHVALSLQPLSRHNYITPHSPRTSPTQPRLRPFKLHNPLRLNTDGHNHTVALLEQYSNSIQLLVVHGLVKDNDGKDALLIIDRGSYAPYLRSAPQHEERHGAKMTIYKNRTIESRPAIPPDGALEVHVTIEEQLYKAYDQEAGRAVYTVSVDTARSSPEIQKFQIPPLVIKIASERGGHNLAEEAAMYDYLLCLQGSVIPRCYGYFRRVVNLQDYVVVPWSPKCKLPRSKADLDIFQMPNAHASLNVLLLEHAGHRIPCGGRQQSDLKELW